MNIKTILVVFAAVIFVAVMLGASILGIDPIRVLALAGLVVCVAILIPPQS